MTATAERVAAVLDRYEAVVGIEIHCQLKTASKMFCGCSTAYDGAAPNTHVCPVRLGLPGTPPGHQPAEPWSSCNRDRSGNRGTRPGAHAVGAQELLLPRPAQGLPDQPVRHPARGGRPASAIETSDGPFIVNITRAHLEEDTAKLVHGDAVGADGRRTTLVDFNRSGAPLMEIVTEPELRTAGSARRYAEELQLLLRAIGASDADMERGQMRVEANVSLRLRGEEPFGTRVEVKNMNSFRAVERAIAFEIERQAAALDAGDPLTMETRGWDDGRQATYRMRAKETSDDYRYFPEPDLPPLHVEADWIAGVRSTLPELPAARRARYEGLGITHYDAAVIVADPGMTGAFEAISAPPDRTCPAKEVANFVSGAHARAAKAGCDSNAAGTAGASSPDGIAKLLAAIVDGRVSRPSGRELLDRHLADGSSADALLAGAGPGPISDDEALFGHVDAVIAADPKAVEDYRAGKPVVGFFVGQVMKATGGAADAARVTVLVRQRLDAEA